MSMIRDSLMTNAVNRDNQNSRMLQDFRNTKDVENYEVVDEKIYYNLKLYNDGLEPIPVRFNINRVDSIIENNTQEWEVGVENFSVPTYLIPILLTFEDDAYTISITEVATKTTFDINVPLRKYVDDDQVFDYESIVLAVNENMASLCDDIFGLTEYPFILYNGSGSFDFYFPPLFTTNRQDPLNKINRAYRITFDLTLSRLFNCFETDSEGTFESSLRQGENLITWNGVDYTVRKSQWDPRAAMIRWTRILFLTDTIPIRDELIGTENNKMQSQLLDYIINNRILDTTNINYFPQYVKYNNLLNSADLRRMTVRVMLEYEDGTLYPLEIVTGTNFFMKIVFRRKNNGLMIK